MPTSLDPQPAENEIECARCGAFIYYELTRCPNCGVNLYEPEADSQVHPGAPASAPGGPGLLDKLRTTFRRLLDKPYTAQDVFGDALDQAALYNDLLAKTGGDHDAVDRLIEYERQRQPDANRRTCLENAIRRWERDNRTSSPGGEL